MNDADHRLEALLRADLPAAHDPVFRLAVLQRMERRGFALRMGLVLALGLIAAAAVWVILPSLASAVRAAPIAAGVPLAGLILVSALAFAWGVYRAFRSA